jgi:pimeloyl-ACP methyl ester carboxylesterase
MSYDVRPFLSRILRTPVLMSVAEKDDITLWEEELAVFNQIAKPDKQLFFCRDTSHMTLYRNPSRLAQLAEQGRDFLVAQLGPC